MTRLLPTELVWSLLVVLNSASAQQLSTRDAALPCGGNLAPLNVNGQSPGAIYEALQEPCYQQPGTLLPQECRCNLPVYNIKMAYAACQQDEIQSWSQWVQDNQCMNITESPPSDIPYTITMLTVPKWAYQDLSNGQFNLDAALTQARTWSPIQIALPIIVGLIVALAALLLFLWYRRRHQGAFTGRRRSQKPWQSANLHAPRRFFGLVPQRFTVRSRGSPGPQWEIDENVVLGEDDDPAKAGDSRPGSRTSAHSHPHSHSRGASTASLLTTGSARSSQPRSILDVLASKLSSVSLAKRYQNGAAKGPDYKRVRVASAGAGQPFNIDQDMATPVAHTFDAPAPPRPRQDSVESAGLPSVLDIRAPSRAPSAAGSRALRDDSLPLSEAPTDLLPPSVFRSRSEFSLGTTDLMTPTSPSSLDQQGDIGSRPNHQSVVSPWSPLLPANRFDIQPPIREVSGFIDRRESTDSLAHELYPRGPSYEY